jgi:hypothetical protein
MTTEERETLLSLSRKLIGDLFSEMKDQLDKMHMNLTIEEKNEIMANCDGLLAKIKSRIKQIENL